MKAFDIDSEIVNGAILYEMINSHYTDPSTFMESPPFVIDASTSKIVVDSMLDFERTERYKFQIRAYNLQPVTSSSHISLIGKSVATIIVEVIDVNDCIPIFPDSPFKFDTDSIIFSPRYILSFVIFTPVLVLSRMVVIDYKM